MMHIHASEEPYVAHRNMVLQWGQATIRVLFNTPTTTLPQTCTIHAPSAQFNLTASHVSFTHQANVLAAPAPPPPAVPSDERGAAQRDAPRAAAGALQAAV